MKVKVNWTEIAKEDYWKNIDYLNEYWTIIEVQKFMDEVSQTIKLLELGRVTFKKSEFPNVFEVPVVPQIQLYYHFLNDHTIELLRFWSNLKDPKSLKL
jgi:hypothetical protein